jgi:iron complex outermembrane receptor protein
MIKNIISIFFIIICSQNLFGQLKGYVYDSESNEPIPFASLLLVDLGTGTTSNEKGKFIFNNEISNHSRLKISALGYSEVILEINESTNRENLNVKLESKHYHLHEAFISTGTGVLQDYSITSIASKPLSELNVLSNSNLGESIANLEGVYNASTGKGIFKPVIRGLSGVRVLSFLNGVKLENQQWGGDHSLGVSSIGIGHVEVIKGPSSLLYGADALGGVLYLKDETFAESNSIEINTSSQYETNTKGITNGLGFKWSKNNVRLNVFANQQNYADYQVPDGQFVKSSRFKGLGTKFLLGYNRKKWVSNLGYNYSNNTIGIPGHTHDTLVTSTTFLRSNQVREEGRPSQKVQNHLISFDNQFFFHTSNLKITLGQMINKFSEYEKYTIPDLGVNLNTSTYYLRYKYKFSKNRNLITGIQGAYQQNSNVPEAEEVLIPNFSNLDNGAFGIFAGKYKKVNYQFGLRLDNRNIDVDNTKNNSFNYSGLSYSAGGSYVAKHFSFSLNLSSGLRNPHVSELLSEGGHSAAQRYEIGDVNLKPESGNQLDFSIKYDNEHVNILVNPFVNFLSNYIYLEPTDSAVDGFQVFYYRQVNKAILLGGEAVFHYHPHFLHDFHLESTFSFVYGENQNNEALSFIPQPRLSTQLTYNFDNDKKRAFAISDFTIQHQYFGNQNRTVDFELASSNYNLLNVGLNSNITLNSGYIAILGVGVHNVINEEYIDHLSALKNYNIPNSGRNFYVSLKLNINQKINQK